MSNIKISSINMTSCMKMPSADVEDLRKELATLGQDHLLKFWSRLTSEQKSQLVADIQSVDFNDLATAFKETVTNRENNQKLDLLLEPIPEEIHEGISRCTPKQLQEYQNIGLREIAEGRVAALLLAGGQGTRLGVNYPKGMYDVGLPSRKTLYQLQGERLLKLQELAEKQTGKRGTIPWYIMTSEHTMEPTIEFFANHNYFGLQKENLVVFEQYMLPCLTQEGKIILETPWRISKAPDGNGGLFRALRLRGILDDLSKRGIKYVHVYCVDNILVKMADPVFIGYCISKNANCAAKVVEKVTPTEAVGVVCRVGGKFQVVEYSEISSSTAQKRNPDGRLTFNAGNICNHFFTVDFLHQIGCGDKKLKYHVAQKKIAYVGEDGKTVKPLKPNGIKLEKFVFDVFEFSDKFAAWEVHREAEFSPLKNADDSAKDTPTTARNSLYALHKQYIRDAGGRFEDEKCDSFVSVDLAVDRNGDEKKDIAEEKNAVGICEISPLVSYAGEDLEELVAGRTFKGPVIINSPREEYLKKDANGNADK
ncbi:UDP-N-acetylhexosamine pyrophosphorylase [Trichonephila inaurata madagascariensis]|uniref:UDP-N-acetylglucosamine diphosphorylase n=1 Tax=Trichonephila inaurata madagascariensis TaxID=2747483 RepID=A0A8X6YLE8_9ARAC|nr:UDP-N-acetylhexosamine pyrophosphorylase [Trichonephila inaurata madagascariensis]